MEKKNCIRILLYSFCLSLLHKVRFLIACVFPKVCLIVFLVYSLYRIPVIPCKKLLKFSTSKIILFFCCPVIQKIEFK